jgi:hypothetical protein
MAEIFQLLLQLSTDIKFLKDYILSFMPAKPNHLIEDWVDGNSVMEILKVSPRTLQTLRDKGMLPFSKINGKFYYKPADIEKLLSDNYITIKQHGHGN